MNIERNLLATFAIALTVFAAVPVAAQDESLFSAVGAGEANVNLRYRYETVDQASFDEDAHASTLRLRLNYATGRWRAWSAFVEFDHVFEVLSDRFNSGSGTSGVRRNVYPVIADPDGTDLNQLYLEYSPGDDWQARVGRQRILLDDQRFVGGVGWRQNEQTYDGMSVRYRGFERTGVFYAYVGNVNRIFGSGVSAGDHRQDTHLLNANVWLTNNWNLTGYVYLIDNEDAPVFSTRTLGMRVRGGLDAGGGRVELLGEAATQADNAGNPGAYNAGYLRFQADWTRDRLTLGAGMESLGSDGGEAFRTPLATLHAFNGWADQFLTTPQAGLDDLYLQFGYRPGRWSLRLVYHDFSAESGSTDYGAELDVSAGRKLNDRYGLLLKAADFRADDPALADATKLWVMLTAEF